MGCGESCGGNVCFSGFEDTCGKSFPCPVAHPGFHGQCEIPERIDLKEESVITFDNVENKNLAATTSDAGMLVKNGSSPLGVFSDLLIYAVDDDGDRIALGSEEDCKIWGLCLKLNVVHVDQGQHDHQPSLQLWVTWRTACGYQTLFLRLC